MKSILRRGAIASFIVSTLIGSFLVNAGRALAIPEQEIIKILDRVPVFLIGNNQGVLLTTEPGGDKKGPKVALAFTSPKDAQSYLEQVKKANPNVGSQGKVFVQPLSAIYIHNKESKEKKDVTFVFECCIPSQQNVKDAVELLQKDGKKVDQLKSTPLFVARFKDKKGYLVAREGEKIVDWPIFFSKADLMAALEPLKKQDPKLANNIEVEVLDLASLMATMTSKNEASFSAIRLVPPRDAIEYVVKNQPAGGASQSNAPKPAAKPAPKK
ncbi:MAG TPA: hypothetical protein IGS53_17860 [Leptolyngbyaceae cyanobacterium M33_DOE_097]|uniref:Tic22 family protein n=1 Tax=Oscillatoriales cyanobacterium SpSt-418 TaxID=2282169 RepID=A0A7C3KG04_9CYAN|nr:hypothetical protein [Leptolyngbyaceae cyanobacterium M33_DOE_097]